MNISALAELWPESETEAFQSKIDKLEKQLLDARIKAALDFLDTHAHLYSLRSQLKAAHALNGNLEKLKMVEDEENVEHDGLGVADIINDLASFGVTRNAKHIQRILNDNPDLSNPYNERNGNEKHRLTRKQLEGVVKIVLEKERIKRAKNVAKAKKCRK